VGLVDVCGCGPMNTPTQQLLPARYASSSWREVAWHATRNRGVVRPGCPGRARRSRVGRHHRPIQWAGRSDHGAPQATPVASSAGRGDRARRTHGCAQARTTCATYNGACIRSWRPLDGPRAGDAQRSLARSDRRARRRSGLWVCVCGGWKIAGRSTTLRPVRRRRHSWSLVRGCAGVSRAPPRAALTAGDA
jgi:hypothetical protein